MKFRDNLSGDTMKKRQRRMTIIIDEDMMEFLAAVSDDDLRLELSLSAHLLLLCHS